MRLPVCVVCARARVAVLNMNVAPDRLREAFSSGYSVRCWRCWQLWDARQQLGKHEALTSLSSTPLCVCLERVEGNLWIVYECVAHTVWRSVCFKKTEVIILYLYIFIFHFKLLIDSVDFKWRISCVCYHLVHVSAVGFAFVLCHAELPTHHRSGCVCPCVKTAAHH